MRSFLVFACLLFVGCGSSPDRVEVVAAPDVVSSQSGTLTAKAAVFGGSASIANASVLLHVDYTDRNGTAHQVQDQTVKTNDGGEYEAVFQGFTWEGVGTITASVLDDKGQPFNDSQKQPITNKATFSVLDLSPPIVTITTPTAGSTVGSAQNGFQFTVTITATDEIGVSQTFFQAVSGQGGNLNLNRTGSRINGSGSTSVTTDYEVNQGGQDLKAGDTITLTAMAVDLSGNIGVAPAINVIVGP